MKGGIKMTREEKIKALYEETYEDEALEEVSIEEMEEELKEYYSAAGFDVENIDELLKNHEENPEFINSINEKIEKILSNK